MYFIITYGEEMNPVNEIIRRSVPGNPLWRILEKYNTRSIGWEKTKAVCVVSGLSGCGKTTWLLDYFKDKNAFYFSFGGYDEALAEKLLAGHVAAGTGAAVSGWEESFREISARYRYVIFDGMETVLSYKRFREAFYGNMITNIHARPFVVFVAPPAAVMDGFADKFDCAELGYFSVPETMKLFPELAKADILGLCAASGGIPTILGEYDVGAAFEDNLRNMLKGSSAFVRFMPELLSKYFRRPESYHRVLHALANGCHSVSEVGKFTGFAYNKCDAYLSGLVSHRFIIAEKAISKRGAEKTAYLPANSYFRIWHKYIYADRSAIMLGNADAVEQAVRGVVDAEIHAFHLERAFALARKRLFSFGMWAEYGIPKKEMIAYAPETVRDGRFSYDFDAIIRHNEKAVFIKVFGDPAENCKMDEIKRIRRAVALANAYYESHVFIFAKRRFSDYAVYEAARDESISLVEVERLKY